MGETLLLYVIAAVLVGGATLPFFLRSRRREAQAVAAEHEAKRQGLDEPLTLHPVVDPDRCISTGSCIDVCPEGDVLVAQWRVVPDAHRLLGERHRRRLRPGPREHQAARGREPGAPGPDQRLDQPDPQPDDADLVTDLDLLPFAVLPRRPGPARLLGGAGDWDRDRDVLLDLHRLADPCGLAGVDCPAGVDEGGRFPVAPGARPDAPARGPEGADDDEA